MTPLNLFSLPLPAQPPDEYGWHARSVSDLSTLTAFERGLDERDKFLGINRCVVCGRGRTKHCHISPQSEKETWFDLRQRSWVPLKAKKNASNEPRNGLLMCPNHHDDFDAYMFFIRYMPEAEKFVLFNHSSSDDLAPYHGKAIALDIRHHHAPFPTLFIIHEMRVRGHYPFHSTVEAPHSILWQDWISSSGVLRSDPTHGFFNHQSAPAPAPTPDSVQPQQQQQSIQPGDGLSQGTLLGINDDVVAKILAATRASPSWKACEMEGTSWAGTAEENSAKYISMFGVENVS